MTAIQIFNFIKPHLDNLSQTEKDDLARLIAGHEEFNTYTKKRKKRVGKYDHIPSVEDYKRMFLARKKKNPKM